MDIDIVIDSGLSLKSRSFLHWVDHRVRRMWNQSSKDVIQRQRFYHLVNFLSFRHWKHLISWERIVQKVYVPSKSKNREQSHNETDVRRVWKVDSRTTRWDFWSDSKLGRFLMEKITFGRWWRSHQSLAREGLCIFIFCVMFWKDKSEPRIKFWFGRKVDLVEEFITIQIFGHTWWWSHGIVSGILHQPNCSFATKSKSSWGRRILRTYHRLYLCEMIFKKMVTRWIRIIKKVVLYSHRLNGTDSLNWWW